MPFHSGSPVRQSCLTSSQGSVKLILAAPKTRVLNVIKSYTILLDDNTTSSTDCGIVQNYTTNLRRGCGLYIADW